MPPATQAAMLISPSPAHALVRKKNNSQNEYPHCHDTLGYPRLKVGMLTATTIIGTLTSSLLKCTLSSNDGNMSLRHFRLTVITLQYNMEILGALVSKPRTTLQQAIGIIYPGQTSSKQCCITKMSLIGTTLSIL